MNIHDSIWTVRGRAPPGNFSPVRLIHLRGIVKKFLLITFLYTTLQLLHRHVLDGCRKTIPIAATCLFPNESVVESS